MSSVTHNRMIKKEKFRKALFHFEIEQFFTVSILLHDKIHRLLPEEVFLRRGMRKDQASGKTCLSKTYY